MKNFIKMLCIVVLFSSCASVKVQKVVSASPKAKDCLIDIYNDISEVKKEYIVLGLLDSRTGNSIWNDRTAQAAINQSKRAACQLGADAVIVTSSGRTKLKIYSYKRGVASLKAIKYQ